MNRRLFFDSEEEALQYIVKNKIDMIDLKFIDLKGQIRHVTLSAHSLEPEIFRSGVGFDGSSVTRFRTTESGDLNIIPDLSMVFLDPFCDAPTLSFFCKIVEADRAYVRFSDDPRYIAEKAELYLRQNKYGKKVVISPEAEFHLFDKVIINNSSNLGLFYIQSHEALRDQIALSSDLLQTSDPHQLGIKDGYHRSPPCDRFCNLRSEIVTVLEECGIHVKYHHHEVGGASQQEIELKFNSLLRACDEFVILKYVIRNIADKHGLSATFMPKPLFNEPGNGMHIHILLTDEDDNSLFYEAGSPFADFSKLGISFIAGILDHGRSLSGLTNPSTNSYRRLVPGYEAPTQLFFSMANRSAAIRIPKYARDIKTKRFEYRPPDAMCNLYLATSAILMAGYDGLKRNLTPEQLLASKNEPAKYIGPVRGSIQKERPELLALIEQVPENLEEALLMLEEDHAYLTQQVEIVDPENGATRKESVMTEELITRWIEMHYADHVEPINKRPTPYEFQLYFNS